MRTDVSSSWQGIVVSNLAVRMRLHMSNMSVSAFQFQSRIVWSNEPDATVDPLGDHATEVMQLVWPSSL